MHSFNTYRWLVFIGATGSGEQTQNGSGGKDPDKIVIYAVSAVAGFLLLFSAVLLMCFLRR